MKGLALSAPPTKQSNPSEGDAQIPGALGNADSNRADTLEIGLEFKLDLRSEDLVVLKELGAGNGGTVSKVQHATTKVVMARKVGVSTVNRTCMLTSQDYSCRCQRKRPQTDRPRTASRSRMQLSLRDHLLRSLSKRSQRHRSVYGVYGRRVSAPKRTAARYKS